MSEEYTDPGAESEMRRRAAWLLVMLVVVAALLVTLMVAFLHGKASPHAAPPGPQLPTAPPTTSRHSGRPGPTSPGGTDSSGSTSATSGGVHEPPRVRHGHVNCPGDSPCVARGDIGNAVAAINAYRTAHGVPAVDGSVTAAAQSCAVTDGSTCSGSWAETEVPQPSGQEVVQKVQALTNLTDPSTTSMQVGWAYDPSAHLYYFAIIQNA